jgi:hypothetical protein
MGNGYIQNLFYASLKLKTASTTTSNTACGGRAGRIDYFYLCVETQKATKIQSFLI